MPKTKHTSTSEQETSSNKRQEESCAIQHADRDEQCDLETIESNSDETTYNTKGNTTKRTITTDKTYATSDPCPCESGLALGECCGKYFDGTFSPSTPEELLRSRYVAHVTHNHAYLIETTHSTYRDEESEADITKWIDQLEWKGFTILTSIGGKEKDTTASIAFIVHFLVNGIPREMKETAHFIKEDGKWFYTYGDVEGHITYRREQPKVGRNDPCACGSGKKYKKCHEAFDREMHALRAKG
ncbi:MAG: SEC-C domain-containing protein, partial [Desulfovibrionaceae bacterium]|nr:SEC-C domain-containing protein [Desulfovibrionaceae bacterium]